jgi:hypothetical protein
MIDQFSETYSDLIEGSYDCPDRIVLNAYFGLGHSPGGFRNWWRRLFGSDENLAKAHLIRLAGRFSRRLQAYTTAHNIPFIRCSSGERKHLIAQQHMPEDPAFSGLFLVLVSRASGLVWDVSHTTDGRIRNLNKQYRFINHYFFHIMDPVWGHVTVRMSSHPPFGAQVILNGHEYVERQAHRAGVQFSKEGNCFTSIIGVADGGHTAVTSRPSDAIGPLTSAEHPLHLAQFAETLCSQNAVGQLRQVCDRWLYSSCLHFVLPEAECIQSGFRYEYSLYQVEYSRNLLFQHGQQMEQVLNGLIDRTRTQLDIKRIKTIFGLKKRPSRRQNNQGKQPREEIVIERPAYNLTIFKLHFGPLTAKLYSKGERVLRCEVIVHNAKALGWKRGLPAFPAIVQRLRQMLQRFLNQLHGLDQCFVADDTIDTLGQPGQVGQAHTTGIDLNQPRLRAVIEAVLTLTIVPDGFTVSQLAAKVRDILGLDAHQYQPRHASYDLKKLRGKQWVEKIGKSRRYQTSPTGLKIMAALFALREKIIKPILAGAGKLKRGPKPRGQSELDIQYGKVQTEMRTLFHILGIAV